MKILTYLLFIYLGLRKHKDKLYGLKGDFKNYITGPACNIDNEETKYLISHVKDALGNFFTMYIEPSGFTRVEKKAIETMKGKREKAIKKEKEIELQELELGQTKLSEKLPQDIADLYKIFGQDSKDSYAKHFFTGLYKELEIFKSFSIDDIVKDLNHKGFTKEATSMKKTFDLLAKEEPPKDDKGALLRFAKEIYLETIDKGLRAPKETIGDPDKISLRNRFRDEYIKDVQKIKWEKKEPEPRGKFLR